MDEKKSRNVMIRRIIVMVIVALIILAFYNPSMLFFLSPHQQKAVQYFTENYIKAFQPLKAADGSFDLLRVGGLLLMFVECWLINAALQFILSLINPKKRRARTIKSLFASFLKYIIVIYAIIYALSMLGFNVGAVIASLGVLGLIIGFGAQSLIEDVITGLFIVLEGQLQVGDIVAIDDWRGTVTNIGIRTTTIVDTGNNARIVNNSDIRNLVNLSNVSSKAIVLAPIAYSTDLEKAEKVVKALCEELPTMYPNIFKVVPQYLGVEALGSSSVDLKIAADVDEANIFTAKRLLNREVFLAFGKAGIEIPFSQHTIHMAKD
ncbi:MAG: mechanosensitive ion channel [Firmicutes bacterium]|nr:mechanosensitive ion channel [Bacillota bacterium]